MGALGFLSVDFDVEDGVIEASIEVAFGVAVPEGARLSRTDCTRVANPGTSSLVPSKVFARCKVLAFLSGGALSESLFLSRDLDPSGKGSGARASDCSFCPLAFVCF